MRATIDTEILDVYDVNAPTFDAVENQTLSRTNLATQHT